MKRESGNPLRRFARLWRAALLCTAGLACTWPGQARAQDDEADEETVKEATIQLTFSQTDSTRTLTARVMTDTIPVPDTDVHFLVDRLFNPLPIEQFVTTDEEGMASADYPMDLPGDEQGMIEVIVRLDDTDTYGEVEKREKVQWGVVPKAGHDHWTDRSLMASRKKAPMFLIIASNLIIAGIWGTILYIVYLVFRIRKAGRVHKQKPTIT